VPTNPVGLFFSYQHKESRTPMPDVATPSPAAPKETKAQKSERLKLAKNPWDAWDEVREFARNGRTSVLPEWTGLYFKWWGIYTQGDGLGATGGVGGEGKATEFFMMRIGLPNGLLTSHQLRTIGHICQKHARNLADITTRQNIQLHWLTLDSLVEVVDQLTEIGLSPKGACGDVVRNVTGCPLAGLDAHELIDSSPLAVEIAHALTANPDFYNLPRKFKVSVSGGPLWCSYPEINDVGLTAIARPRPGSQPGSDDPNQTEIGYTLRVGGGLSTEPHIAVRIPAFVRQDQALAAVVATAEIFREQQELRENRTRARLKYLFMRHGWTAGSFLEALEAKLGYKLDPPPTVPPTLDAPSSPTASSPERVESSGTHEPGAPFFPAVSSPERVESNATHEPGAPSSPAASSPERVESNATHEPGAPFFPQERVGSSGTSKDQSTTLDAAQLQQDQIPEDIYRDHIGITPQKQTGLSAVGASVLRGRLSGDQLLALADLAEQFGDGHLRAAITQNILIANVPNARVHDLIAELRNIDLYVDVTPFWRGAIACTGTEFCKLAISETKAFSKWLVEEMEERLPTFDQQIKLHVTGCTNSCGQHWIADIGLEGKKIKQNGALVDAFFFCVGGSVGKYAKPARPIGYRAAAEDVPEAIERLLRAYLQARQPNEDLRAWFSRTEDELLRAHLNNTPINQLPPPETRDPAPAGVRHAVDA